MTHATSPLRDRMIFLVGARRSGTQWLQRIVGAHPHAALVPSETYLFSRGIKPLRERFHHGVLSSPETGVVYMDREALRHSLRDLCDRVFFPFLQASPGAERLAERTPEHVACLDLIAEIYPDSSIVQIVRDGRDVARSLLSQEWPNAPRSVEEAAEEWRSSVDAGEKAGASIARYRTVRYEDLLHDTRAQLAELYAWFGLPTSPALLDGAVAEAGVWINATVASTAPAAARWREFTEQERATFMRVAGDSLARLGYAERPSKAQESPPVLHPAPGPAGVKASVRSRRLVRSLLSAGQRRKEQAAVGPAADPRRRMADALRTLDRVTAALTDRRLDDLEGLMSRAARIHIVAPGWDWKGRGVRGRDQLKETIGEDAALRGRQVQAHVHVGVPTSTAVMTFLGEDGSRHDRVIAVATRGTEITSLSYYQFPSGSG